MLSLKYKKYNYEFKYPFETSKGVKTDQPTLIIALGINRLLGMGEATEISYHPETIDGMVELLERHRIVIQRYTLIDNERYWHFLHHLVPDQHFLISALDIAGWDLMGKIRRMPVYKLLGLEWSDNVPKTNYTIGISDMETIAQKIQAHPFANFKVKVGNIDDVAHIEKIRSLTDANIRIDANEAWDLNTAKEILRAIKPFNIELIEQPLSKEASEDNLALKEIIDIPIIADEACQGMKDFEKIAPYFDGINVKLSKHGGITPSFQLIKAAKKANKKIMLGCMSEGNIGCGALSHLLPLADYADIDGPLILNDTFAKAVTYDNDTIVMPHREGIGIYS